MCRPRSFCLIFSLQPQSTINFIIRILSCPYPLRSQAYTRYFSPGHITVFCYFFCRWPVAVIKIRRLPSGILVIFIFPACIGYHTIAERTKYPILTTLVYSRHGNNSGISWYDIIRRWCPVVVFPKTHTISKHFHLIITSKHCRNVFNANK